MIKRKKMKNNRFIKSCIELSKILILFTVIYMTMVFSITCTIKFLTNLYKMNKKANFHSNMIKTIN